MRRIAQRRGWGLMVALLVTGCLEVPPMPPVTEETEHFRYRLDEGLPLCPAALEWMEHHYHALTPWFGVALSPGERFDFSVLHQEDVDAYCGANTSGCATEGYAFSNRPFHGHELVHLYAHLLGRPPAFFREGIAEVLGAGWTDDQRQIEPSILIFDILEEGDFLAYPDRREAYELAASFVRFLIDEHGREAFLDFYAHVPATASLRTLDLEVEVFFGETLWEAVQRWLDKGPTTPAEVALHVAECAAPDLDASTMHDPALECGLGPDGEAGVRIHSLEVSHPGTLAMPLPASHPLRVDIFSCGTGLRAASAHSADAPVFEPHLDPGRYWVRLTH